MNYRRLGQAGVRVSEIGLGSWLTYGNAVDLEAARVCVRSAFELGINFFDTADVYAKGEAERALGRILGDFPRASLVVASKCYFAVGEGPNDRGLSRKHILESCEGSLRRLGMDYLDLYQAHRFDPDVPLEEVVSAMDHLVRVGKVLYWGTSTWSGEQLTESVNLSASRNLHAQVSDQPCYNMLDRTVEGEVRRAAAALGLGLVVYSPLAQGVLSGKYRGGSRPAGSRGANAAINTFMDRWLEPERLQRVETIRGFARELGCTPAQLALRWCLRLPEVSSVIVGASSPDQVAENAAASGLEVPDEVWQRIDSGP